MGRKSIFSRELIRELEKGILVGMPYDLACDRAGLSRTTFYAWQRGEWPRSVKIADREWFSHTIKAAEAQAIYDALNVIKGATTGQLPPGSVWQAAAWLCERRYPQYFGKRPVEVTGAGGGAIQHNHLLRRYVEEIAEAEGFDVDDLEAETLEILQAGAA